MKNAVFNNLYGTLCATGTSLNLSSGLSKVLRGGGTNWAQEMRRHLLTAKQVQFIDLTHCTINTSMRDVSLLKVWRIMKHGT